jgi:outer membrane immunogenic protein
MKRVFIAAAAVLAVATTMTAASAADMAHRRMPVKAPAYVEETYNWTGFYAGINGGYGFGNSAWSAATGTSSFDTSGGLVGGTVGYNRQMGAIVLGLEGDIDASWIKGTTAGAPCTTSCETSNSWLGTARGRVGYAFNRVLPYVTGGAAFGDIKATPAGFGGVHDTNIGWTAGAGVEVTLAGRWSAKAEYLYADLGDTNCAAGRCAVSTNADFTTNIVRGGVNYHF